jgi:hypothetical protein
VHVAPACAGFGEWSDHFGSYVRSLSLHFCKSLFSGIEPMSHDLMVTGKQLYHCARAPLWTHVVKLFKLQVYL